MKVKQTSIKLERSEPLTSLSLADNMRQAPAQRRRVGLEITPYSVEVIIMTSVESVHITMFTQNKLNVSMVKK